MYMLLLFLYFLLQTKPLYLYCLRSSITIFMTRTNCLRCIISSNGTLQDISVRIALASSEGSGEQKHYRALPDRVHLFYVVAVFIFSATDETIILVLLKEQFNNIYDKKKLFTLYHFFKWDIARYFGKYRIGEQQRFRQVCAYAQTRQSFRCLHTQSSVWMLMKAQTKR